MQFGAFLHGGTGGFILPSWHERIHPDFKFARERVAAFGGGRRPIIATKLAGYMDDGGRIRTVMLILLRLHDISY